MIEKMKRYPKFATSPICVTDEDYEFCIDPELITIVEFDPFHGYELKLLWRTLLNCMILPPCLLMRKIFATFTFLSFFLFH